jgi:hypothetical protein
MRDSQGYDRRDTKKKTRVTPIENTWETSLCCTYQTRRIVQEVRYLLPVPAEADVRYRLLGGSILLLDDRFVKEQYLGIVHETYPFVDESVEQLRLEYPLHKVLSVVRGKIHPAARHKIGRTEFVVVDKVTIFLKRWHEESQECQTDLDGWKSGRLKLKYQEGKQNRKGRTNERNRKNGVEMYDTSNDSPST